MRLKTCAALACLASVLAVCNTASAIPVTWTIVSSASNVSFSIPQQTLTITSTSSIPIIGTSLTASIRALNPGTGSASTQATSTVFNGSTFTGANSAQYVGNKQNIQGTFDTDTDFVSTIDFLTSNIEGVDSGLYAPPNNLLPTPTTPVSGDIGLRIWVRGLGGLLVSNVTIDAAIRSLFYDVSSGVIALNPLGGGNSDFASTGLTVGSVAGATLAFQARNGGGLGGGTLVSTINGAGPLANLPALSAANASKVASKITNLGGGKYQMDIPISIPVKVPLDDDGLIFFNASIAGSVTATAIIPEPGTFALFAVGLGVLAPAVVRRWRKRA